MNRIIIMLGVFILILSVFSSCTPDAPVYENETDAVTETQSEEKSESQEYTVYVLIKKEYSEIGKEYSPEDFDKELVESVEVINQFYPEDDTSNYRMEQWQQKLRLKLKEPTEENAKTLIISAYKNPQVEVAGYDSLCFNIPDVNDNSVAEYDTSTIMVLIKKECSEFGKEYYPKNFDKNLIKSVRVINQINPGDDTSGYDLDNWQQILSLELKEPSEENVQKAIEAALRNPEVDTACRNYKTYLVE